MTPNNRARFPRVGVGADYTDEEREFMLAMEKYKRDTRQPFPAWSEVLMVAKSLGYRLVEPAKPSP